MEENKNFVNPFRYWWACNRRVVKAGIICGLVGVTYGIIKGVTMTNNIWLSHDVPVTDIRVNRHIVEF